MRRKNTPHGIVFVFFLAACALAASCQTSGQGSDRRYSVIPFNEAGEAHGQWTYRDKNFGTKMIEGNFERGIAQGVWKYYSAYGKEVISVNYRNGVFSGPFEISPTYEKKPVDPFVKDIVFVHGEVKAKEVVGSMVNGKLDGTLSGYDRNGEVITRATMRNGKVIDILDGTKDDNEAHANFARRMLREFDGLVYNIRTKAIELRQKHGHESAEPGSLPDPNSMGDLPATSSDRLSGRTAVKTRHEDQEMEAPEQDSAAEEGVRRLLEMGDVMGNEVY